MTDDEVDSFENYSTGPFCRHYGDPSDCDDVCGRCGHLCHQHDQYEDDSECNVDNCFCNTWAEEDEVQTSLDAMKQHVLIHITTTVYLKL